MSVISETCVSQQTYLANLDSFPKTLKLSYANAIQSDKPEYDKILIIYYNDFLKNKLFSFEHLCFELNKISEIPAHKLIQNYKKTGQWNLSGISANKINYLLEKLLDVNIEIKSKPRT